MSKFALGFRFDQEQVEKLNKVILQDGFHDRLNEVRKVNLSVTQKPIMSEVSVPFISSVGNVILEEVEEIKGYSLDPIEGNEFAKEVVFAGYDESKFKFLSLEGEAHITTHAIDYYIDEDNIPVCKITFYFYTRSKNIVDNSKFIKYTDDISSQSNLDYATDRNEIIEQHALENSILFIDGPLIGGNITYYSLELVKKLHEKKIVPVFIVKNSDSNLVVDNIKSFTNTYNSDLHWAYKNLKKGQRTNFFKYTDKHNKQFSKIFCYVKPFNYVTPQRVEIHPLTFGIYERFIPELLNLFYYLLLLSRG